MELWLQYLSDRVLVGMEMLFPKEKSKKKIRLTLWIEKNIFCMRSKL